MTQPTKWVFTELSITHIPLLFSWLRSARLIKLYDGEYRSEEEVARKYLALTQSIQRFMVLLEDVPIALMQVYEVTTSHAYAKYRSPKGVTQEIDFFIADERYLGKGYGFQMLKEFIHFLGRKVDRIVSAPLKNSAALSLLQKYGFQEVGILPNRHILAIDIRYTARALILNEQKQILLMKIEDRITVDPARQGDHFWVTIGGTIEKGEEPTQALSREIKEETGLEHFTLGKLAFYGEHTLLFYGFPVRHFETFYLVYVNQAKVHQDNLTEDEKLVFRDMRFWTVQELLTTPETVYPNSLAIELGNVLAEGKIPKEITL